MFKKLSIKAKKMVGCAALATALMSGIMFAGTAYADTVSNISFSATKAGNVFSGAVKKSNATGTAAKVSLNQTISEKYTVNVVTMNQYDNIVSSTAASFHNETPVTKSIAYKSGKGVKGNYFRPRFLLGTGSATSSLPINFTYTA